MEDCEVTCSKDGSNVIVISSGEEEEDEEVTVEGFTCGESSKVLVNGSGGKMIDLSSSTFKCRTPAPTTVGEGGKNDIGIEHSSSQTNTGHTSSGIPSRVSDTRDAIVQTNAEDDSYSESQDECCAEPVDPCCDTHAPLVQVDILPAMIKNGCSCCGSGVSMCPCCVSRGMSSSNILRGQTTTGGRGNRGGGGGGDSITPGDIDGLRSAISELANVIRNAFF